MNNRDLFSDRISKQSLQNIVNDVNTQTKLYEFGSIKDTVYWQILSVISSVVASGVLTIIFNVITQKFNTGDSKYILDGCVKITPLLIYLLMIKLRKRKIMKDDCKYNRRRKQEIRLKDKTFFYTEIIDYIKTAIKSEKDIKKYEKISEMYRSQEEHDIVYQSFVFELMNVTYLFQKVKDSLKRIIPNQMYNSKEKVNKRYIDFIGKEYIKTYLQLSIDSLKRVNGLVDLINKDKPEQIDDSFIINNYQGSIDFCYNKGNELLVNFEDMMKRLNNL